MAQIILFSARDYSGYNGLWETNGTVAGTFELAGIVGAAPSVAGGFNPGNLTAFNGKVVFDGQGKDGLYLWVTNGTAAGTHVVGGPALVSVFK